MSVTPWLAELMDEGAYYARLVEIPHPGGLTCPDAAAIAAVSIAGAAAAAFNAFPPPRS